MRYGTIIYDVRDALNISEAEYLLLDCVCKMQAAPDAGGRCHAGSAYLAYVAGVTQRRVFDMMKRLQNKGLLIINPDNTKQVARIFFDMAIAGDVSVLEDLLQKKEAKKSHDATSSPMTPRHNPYDATSDNPMTPRHNPYDATSYSSTSKALVDKTFIEREYTHASKKNQKFKKQESGEGEKVNTLVCLFRETEYFKGGAAGRAEFEKDLKAAGCPDNVDFDYYFNRALLWSDEREAKSANWGAKVAGFVAGDRSNGKMIIKAQTHEAGTSKYKVKETKF